MKNGSTLIELIIVLGFFGMIAIVLAIVLEIIFAIIHFW